MYKIVTGLLLLGLAACQATDESDTPVTPASDAKTAVTDSPAGANVTVDSLALVLSAQPAEVQARYRYRHPKETLEFFDIRPGMTVVEALPGGGWYTRLLLPYLGSDGHLVGANYALDMWPNFPFGTEEFVDKQRTWTTDWPAKAEDWRGENGATIGAFVFGSMPASLSGTADAVLFIRAMHNLANFEEKGGYMTAALADSFTVLKPGGTLGIVQHQARDDMSDEFAAGGNGYLKKAFVIDAAQRAGFEFVAESDVNTTPKDQPTEEDIVWRLPPSLATSSDDPELKAILEAVGESNRMTLKFRKPD